MTLEEEEQELMVIAVSGSDWDDVRGHLANRGNVRETERSTGVLITEASIRGGVCVLGAVLRMITRGWALLANANVLSSMEQQLMTRLVALDQTRHWGRSNSYPPQRCSSC